MVGEWEDGWAVVLKGTTNMCFTSAPPIIGEGSVWQIYKTKEEAHEFCKRVKFSDAKYAVMQVKIIPDSTKIEVL